MANAMRAELRIVGEIIGVPRVPLPSSVQRRNDRRRTGVTSIVPGIRIVAVVLLFRHFWVVTMMFYLA